MIIFMLRAKLLLDCIEIRSATIKVHPCRERGEGGGKWEKGGRYIGREGKGGTLLSYPQSFYSCIPHSLFLTITPHSLPSCVERVL